MIKPLAIVLESTVAEDCPPEEIRELRENSLEIAAVLEQLGYRTEVIAFTLDVEQIRRELVRLNPSVVFNLVDSIEGKGNLIAMAPMLLTHLGIAYTGAHAVATTATCDKLLTKQILQAHAIATPSWMSEQQIREQTEELDGAYILKSITEHASFGIFADSVVQTRCELQTRLLEKQQRHGGSWFAERYVDGREFNLSVLGGAAPRVLPPAEILFTNIFPADKPKIVDYAAKWYTESAEYQGTVRGFEFSAQDAALLDSLTAIAARCFTAFGLTGYARVDFRVDSNSTPTVLEVNSNPFLSAQEGFGAAAARAGLSFSDTIHAIVCDAYRVSGKVLPQGLAA